MTAAICLVQGDQNKAKDALSRIPTSQVALWGVTENDEKTHAKFVAAINGNDAAFIRDYRNWRDELSSWFSPFETDETGIHGREDMVNPYPPKQPEKERIPTGSSSAP